MPAALPCERTPVPIEWDAMWAPELVWIFWKKKYLATAGIRTLGHPAHSLVAIPTSEVADLLLFVHRRDLAKNRKGGAKSTHGY